MAQQFRNKQATEEKEETSPGSKHSHGVDYGFDESSVNNHNKPFSGESSSASLEQGGSTWGNSMWGDTPDEEDEESVSSSENEDDDDYDDDDDDDDNDDEDESYDDDDDGHETFEDEEEETSSSEDNTYDGDNQTMASERIPGNMKQFNSMVETGDWDGVIGAASGFGTASKDDDDSYVPRRASMDYTYSSGLAPPPEAENESDENSDSESEETSSRATSAASSSQGTSQSSKREGSVSVSANSYTSEELRSREKYLKTVEELVKKVVPDEADNVANMMDQFAGREEELIHTLQTMYERSYSVRARKAMHKSKGIPESGERSSGRFVSGGAEGSAAVAAASTIGVGFERPMENFDSQQSESHNDDDDEESSSEEESDGESNSDEDYEGEADPSSVPSFEGELEGLSGSDSGSYEDDDDDDDEPDYDVEPSVDGPDYDDDPSSSGSYEDDDDDDDGGFGDAVSNDYDDNEDSSYSSDSSYEDD